MKKVFRAALISLGLLIVYGISIATAKAQSLTSVPKPSAEIVGLTKALTCCRTHVMSRVRRMT